MLLPRALCPVLITIREMGLCPGSYVSQSGQREVRSNVSFPKLPPCIISRAVLKKDVGRTTAGLALLPPSVNGPISAASAFLRSLMPT